MQLLANAHRELIINGHRHTNFAEEDRPIEWGTGEDLVEIKVGQDGTMYGQSIPMLGNSLMIRLSPTSPSCQWWIRENEYRKQALINKQPHRVYSGTDADPVQGRTMRGEGGVLLQCPDFLEPGQTFEVQLQFERTIPNVDGAKFDSLLDTAI